MTTAVQAPIDNEVYVNNFMKLTVESFIKDKTDKTCNYAVVNRLQDNTFIVVRNLTVDNESKTCTWGYAIEYDIKDASYATSLLIEKATSR